MDGVQRFRLEKAAADCGFEMTPEVTDDGVRMRSARFPESVTIRPLEASAFAVVASHPLLVDGVEEPGGAQVQGYSALYATLRCAAARARTMPNRVADTFRAQTASMPKSTEAERLVVQRVGQGLFRAALLDYWQERCCVSGLAVPELLRASHIKPWAICDSDDERLDVFNGLLLAPHLDALFDGGWISFGDDGSMIVSSRLPDEARAILNLAGQSNLNGITAAHRKHLSFHREHVLRAKLSTEQAGEKAPI